jgi:hypothetical protein
MKIRILIFFIFLYSSIFSQTEENVNTILDFSGKISKGNIVLSWKIVNPKNVYICRIEEKKSGNMDYDNIKEIPFNSYFTINTIDTNKIYSFTTKYKPKENGVYYLKVNLLDNINSILNTSEIKIGFSEIKEFKLYQNTPNPFNPSTTINYEIFVPTKVNLRVYDLSGKEIDLLVDDYQQPGTYKVDFNANKFGNFSSGIYFYKLQTNYTSDIKKMIFAK